MPIFKENNVVDWEGHEPRKSCELHEREYPLPSTGWKSERIATGTDISPVIPKRAYDADGNEKVVVINSFNRLPRFRVSRLLSTVSF